jgi:hypothetical protein
MFVDPSSSAVIPWGEVYSAGDVRASAKKEQIVPPNGTKERKLSRKCRQAKFGEICEMAGLFDGYDSLLEEIIERTEDWEKYFC